MNQLVITVDKVKHCLKMMGTDVAPLRTLTYQEIFEILWEGKETSDYAPLTKVLHDLIDKLEKSPEQIDLETKFWQAKDQLIVDKEGNLEENYKKAFFKSLELIKGISECFRKIKDKNMNTVAIADILYLSAHTYTYFTPTNCYKKFMSEKVNVRRCDVNAEEKYKKNKSALTFQDESEVIFEG